MKISNETEKIKTEIFDIFETRCSILLFEACMSIVTEFMEAWMDVKEWELKNKIKESDIPP